MTKDLINIQGRVQDHHQGQAQGHHQGQVQGHQGHILDLLKNTERAIK